MSGPVRRIAVAMGLLLAVSGTLAGASDNRTAEQEIADRLNAWTAAFNARDAEGACDLFAPDLVYSLAEVPQGTRETLCGNFERVFAQGDVSLSYAEPDIHEIIVSGDLAVVRLAWTLTVRRAGESEESVEEGIDVFRRQPDGRWSIARFIAFTRSPPVPAP